MKITDSNNEVVRKKFKDIKQGDIFTFINSRNYYMKIFPFNDRINHINLDTGDVGFVDGDLDVYKIKGGKTRQLFRVIFDSLYQ